MKSRVAIQTAHGEPLIIDELEFPDPEPDQVVVKMLSSGICHSQLHQIHNKESVHPLVLGHEGTGIVAHKGSRVTDLEEGDHAIVTWVSRTPITGPTFHHLSGVTYHEELVSPGVFTWAEDVLAHRDNVVPISKEEPTDLSCIVGCAVLTGAGAVMHTARVRPGDSVAIFGVGGVGLSAIRMAAILEADPIIAVDLRDDKLAFAREFGATLTVNASEVDPVEAIVDLTDGGADFVFDAIGVRKTTEQILAATREGGAGADNHGGMAVLIGIPTQEMTIDPMLFIRQRRYRGSVGATYPDKDFPLYLRWHREGKFPLDKLITRRYKLEQINQACDDLEAGEILGRAIIEY